MPPQKYIWSPTRPVECEGRAIAGKTIKFSAARKAALHQVGARRNRRGFVAERVVEQAYPYASKLMFTTPKLEHAIKKTIRVHACEWEVVNAP